jgi:hypothetical protein
MLKLPLKLVLSVGFFLWLGLIALSYSRLLRYSFAGTTSKPPPTVPALVSTAINGDRFQMFLALHPRCPCSRATLAELEKILSRVPTAGEVTVLMYKPAGETDRWVEGPLLDQCRVLKCRVKLDPDGQLATALGSLTSGGMVIYDSSGKLRYHGGITSARGHEGDNAGKQAVLDVLQNRSPSVSALPVFGCPLQQETSKEPRL